MVPSGAVAPIVPPCAKPPSAAVPASSAGAGRPSDVPLLAPRHSEKGAAYGPAGSSGSVTGLCSGVASYSLLSGPTIRSQAHRTSSLIHIRTQHAGFFVRLHSTLSTTRKQAKPTTR